jgi:hypothetical protein
MKRLILVQALICILFLSACGGSSSNKDIEPPIEEPLQVGGIWKGEITAFSPSQSPLTPNPLITIYTTDPVVTDTDNPLLDIPSQFRLVSSSAIQAKGSIIVTEGIAETDDILTSLTLTAFAPQGVIFSDGNTTAACSITAIFMEAESINGTYECSGANSTETGSFNADYQATLYEQPSSFNRVSGIWSGLDFSTTNNNVVLTLPVRDDGSIILGSNTDGCFYTGQIDIIDPAFNLYDISLTSTDCSFLDDIYTGLATLTQGINGNPDEFVYQIDNDSFITTQPVYQNK